MLAAVKWVVGFGLVFLVSIPINGLLIAATWGWFVVPATGAREISVAEGIGLSLFLSVAGRAATAHLVKFDVEANDTAASNLAKVAGIGVFGPLVTLAIAWAWHAFVLAPNSN